MNIKILVLVLLFFAAAASAQENDNIKVVLDHIIISQKNNSFGISEIVVLRNEGSEIYYSRENHTYFAISTPPEAQDIKTELMECCLVKGEGMVFMDPMQTIAPGDSFEMRISYTIAPGSKEYAFNKTAVYDTASLSVFVDRMPGSDGHETLTLDGNEYNVVTFEDIKAGETVTVPVAFVKDNNYLYAVTGLLLLSSLGLVCYFKLVRRRKCTLEELELEKRKIFHIIHGFEKHAAKGSEYEKLINEYRQRAIQIFIKIDKIKREEI